MKRIIAKGRINSNNNRIKICDFSLAGNNGAEPLAP